MKDKTPSLVPPTRSSSSPKIVWWFMSLVGRSLWNWDFSWSIMGCVMFRRHTLRYIFRICGLFAAGCFTSCVKTWTSCCPMAPKLLPFPWFQFFGGGRKFLFMVRSLIAGSKTEWDKQSEEKGSLPIFSPFALHQWPSNLALPFNHLERLKKTHRGD